MDYRKDAGEFLRSRRARITPQEAGLPVYGGNRRVPGLRREEVALLAGVSVDYYTRLERGNLRGVSESVLEAIAGALHLEEAERRHLFDLSRAANRVRRTAPVSSACRLRPSIRRVLDAMDHAPAAVRNARLDVLGANRMGRALYAPLWDSPLFAGSRRCPNYARFTFLDPAAQDFYVEWDSIAADTVAILRTSAGLYPCDQALASLIGELSMRSETFRTLWARHDVRLHISGVKRIHHPVVGRMELTYESLELPGDAGLRMSAYTAEPDTPSADALLLLDAWAEEVAPDDAGEVVGAAPRFATEVDTGPDRAAAP